MDFGASSAGVKNKNQLPNCLFSSCELIHVLASIEGTSLGDVFITCLLCLVRSVLTWTLWFAGCTYTEIGTTIFFQLTKFSKPRLQHVPNFFTKHYGFLSRNIEKATSVEYGMYREIWHSHDAVLSLNKQVSIQVVSVR